MRLSNCSKQRQLEKEYKLHPQLKMSSLHLRRQKTESSDPRVSKFLSNYGGEQEAPEVVEDETK